jgi:NadR type nicotinamide-nucleotide adenylyltransferase
VIRVVLTGSECTGKTTLAAALAEYLGAEFVPEYAREYAERKHGRIEAADTSLIAQGQLALEDAAIARGTPIIVQDTDLLSTVVYSAHYFGECPEWIAAAAAARRPDLHLLCDIDVPWVADGVRDRGDRRAELQAAFREAVRQSGAPMVELRGDITTRMNHAVEAVEAIRLRGTPGDQEKM